MRIIIDVLLAIAILVLLYVGLFGLTGCQTAKGLCQDISWTAEKVNQAIVVPE